jgi:hypothetical protein
MSLFTGVIYANGGNSSQWNTGVQTLGTSGNTITLTSGGSVTAPYATNADTVDGQHASAFMSAGTDNWVNVTGDTMSGDLNFNNYGIGMVGTYSATRYQGVFSMGSAYKLASNGTSPGTLYGIAWTHSNIGGQSISGLGHQALFMENGVTQTAIGNGVWTRANVDAVEVYARGWLRNSTANTGIYNQAHGAHFYASAANVWNMGGGNAYPQLIFRDNHASTIRGYVYADSSGFGLLHSGGGWAVRTSPGSDAIYIPGKVGIGTTDASTYRIYGRTSNATDWGYRFNNDSNSSNVHIAHGGGYGLHINAGTNASASTYALEVYAAGATRMYVRGDGNVGIGTTGPSSRLDVRDSTTGSAIQGINSSTGTGVYGSSAGTGSIGGGVYGYNSTSGNGVYGYSREGAGVYGYSSTNVTTSIGVKARAFYASGYDFYGEGPRSYFSGNVGIGNSAPSYKLDVSGDIRSTGSVIAGTPGSSWLTGKTGTSGFNAGTAQTVSAYHPMLRQTTSSGHVVNLGGLGNAFGFYGYDVNRTVNGYDYSFIMDLSNGNMSSNRSISASNNLSAGGNVTMGGHPYINNASPTVYFQDTDHRSAMIHNNSNIFYVLRGCGNNRTDWCTYNGVWPLEINLENNNASFGGDIYSTGAGKWLSNTITKSGDTVDGVIYFRSNKGSGSYLGSNNTYQLEAYSNDGGAAAMSFHRGGAYAVNMGLDPDNVLRIGGWSAASNRWQLDMSGNNWVAGSFRVVGGASTIQDTNQFYCNSGAECYYNWSGSGRTNIGNGAGVYIPYNLGVGIATPWFKAHVTGGQLGIGSGAGTPAVLAMVPSGSGAWWNVASTDNGSYFRIKTGDTRSWNDSSNWDEAQLTISGDGRLISASGYQEQHSASPRSLTLGQTETDYIPDGGANNYTILLNASEVSSIGFHDAGSSKNSIRYNGLPGSTFNAGRAFIIGANDGWGQAAVGAGRWPTANAFEVEGNASKTTAGSWLANSDIRIKRDIQDLDNALEVVNRLHPVRFKYTDDYRKEHQDAIEDRYYYNYIAQEYQEIFPESVKDSGEKGYLQIDTYNANIYAIAAIQELSKALSEKNERLDSLEKRISELEALFK